MPVVEVIRDRAILRDFPGRTETDLYLWVMEYRATLQQEMGWTTIPYEAAADGLAEQRSQTARRIVSRLGGRLRDVVTPDELEAGPPSGRWRSARRTDEGAEHLFNSILVPVSGETNGWVALDQAAIVARREGARLLGLHVVPGAQERDGERARSVQTEFLQRCQEADVRGELAIAVGNVSQVICDRSRWTELVVVNLAHPPTAQPVARLRSGFRTLIRRCAIPVLAVPRQASPLTRALLAYDGSPKADEALFLATYVAGRWGIALTVLTVIESGRATPDTLTLAREYLDSHGAQATFVEESGDVGEAILRAAATDHSDLIIMGGYGFSPVWEVMLGSSVDRVLNESDVPMLICR
jgi:nucleotide-binding universal stress UspA family protein